MKIKNAYKMFLVFLLISVPAVVYARAGLGELDYTSSLVVVIAFILGVFLLPFGLNGSWVYVWYFSWFQFPLILAIVALTAKRLHRNKAKKLTYFLVLLPLYALLTFSTNIASIKHFHADHSDYFPKGNLVENLYGKPGQTEKPTEAEVLAILGAPLAAGNFSASSQALPDGMAEKMKTSNLESSYILSYFEKCRGRRGMEERTYYVLLDPVTHKYVTFVGHDGPTKVLDKWPHKSFSNNTSNKVARPDQ